MELRQLRYFVTLAEELHFGRAAGRPAGREHIVQTALSQPLQGWNASWACCWWTAQPTMWS
jgi:DNA-binding transcriptional LysR family regulator